MSGSQWVRDTGAGCRADKADQIFNAFTLLSRPAVPTHVPPRSRMHPGRTAGSTRPNTSAEESWLFGRERVIWKKRQLRSPYAKFRGFNGKPTVTK